MTTIAVVDLSNIFWSAYMSRKDADPVSAPHDWTVQKVRRFAEQFPHIGIATDSRESWRRDIFPAYKAGRAERGPEAWAQLEHTTETLRREGFPVWIFEGMEADDIMATVAYQAPNAEPAHDVILITNDKDLRACIRDGSVAVLTPGSSAGAPTKITEANCTIGGVAPKGSGIINPRLVRDYIALVGDGSDNLPGVKGLGPVKAMGLLAAYKSFPGIVAAFEAQDATLMGKAEGRLLAAIVDEQTSRRGIDDAKMTWLLADMRRDVAVDWTEALRERTMQQVPSPMRDATDADFEDATSTPTDGPAMRDLVDTAGDGAAEPLASKMREIASGGLAQAAPASTALAVAAPWAMQLEPTNSGGAVKLAQYLADSRMFPSLATPEQCLAAMLLGRVFGLPAVVSCLNCTPIKGRMSMSSAMVMGIVRANPACEYIDGVDGDDKTCTWVAKRVGRPEVKHTFTMREAERAGYTATRGGDGSWQKDPSGMLWLRTGTRLARRVFSDVIAGVYSVEELTDAE